VIYAYLGLNILVQQPVSVATVITEMSASSDNQINEEADKSRERSWKKRKPNSVSFVRPVSCVHRAGITEFPVILRNGCKREACTSVAADT
jgi:hypothetical protein